MQGIDVTCAALSCLRFASDVSCFVISVSSGLRLQGIDVTCAAISCIRFGPDDFETVS